MPRPLPHALDENAPPTPPGVLLRRLGALAWSHRLNALPALGATSATELATLGAVFAQGLAIDTITQLAQSAKPGGASGGASATNLTAFDQLPAFLQPPDHWSPTTLIIALACAVLSLGLIVGALRYAQRVTDEHFAQACLVDLRTRLYNAIQSLSFSFFDAADSGQLINRVTGDVHSVRMFIQGVMVRGLIALVAAAIFLSYLLSTHFTLTLIALAAFPLQAIVMAHYGRVTKPKFKKQAELVDALIHRFQESISGVRVIRSFGAERAAVDRLNDASARARDHRLELARDQALAIPVVQSTGVLTSALLLGFGVTFILSDRAAQVPDPFTLGALWIFFRLTRQLAGNLESIVMVIAQAPEALAGAERVFKLLDEPPEIQSPHTDPNPGRKPGGETTTTGAPSITFDNVSFAYDPESPVLTDISFTVQPGATVAIVGPTGAGKSTLLALLCRFYDPDSGRITIDDTDLRDLQLHDYRARLGVVFQEPFLFSNTIIENTSFARPGTDIPRLNRVLEDADAREFVDELDEGLETIIGERGVSLSGGQRQRLTIARALLHDPDILILDDATGAVDPLTEARIQTALDDQRAQHDRPRTTFIVAHRLSTLRKADTILVLDHGRLVAQGSHHELMETAGHYREAALIQLALDEHDEGGDA
ncbi:MAG: ABC transporter ATP-binding protein [Phycisphaerales bacterium]